jgi:hypothetical protein
VWVLGGVGLMRFLVAVTTPLLKSPDEIYVKIGFVIGIVGVVALFAALDAVLLLRVRRQ